MQNASSQEKDEKRDVTPLAQLHHHPVDCGRGGGGGVSLRFPCKHRMLLSAGNVWNQTSSDRTSVQIWIQTVCHYDSVPDRGFEKVNLIKRRQHMTTKAFTIIQRAKSYFTCRRIENIHV